ncbi:MAG: hypothetical protein HQ592_00225 [Planctomycetes bacterium]|nr:hypothetical protein [Planctomycetota bacterium]
MNKWQRIEKVLEGGKPDRTPVSLWRHFFREERTAKGLAGAMLEFQKKFDWDFMKVNPRAVYHAEAWGNRYTFGTDDHAKPSLEHSAVDNGDWSAVTRIPPDRGALGEQLEALRMIKAELDSDTPFIMTVFTPLSIASRIVGDDDKMKELLATHPDACHEVLEAITQTFIDFADACTIAGVWGFFYATTTWATTDRITPEEYAEFGRPYDLKLFEAMGDARLNMLHVCQSNNMALDLLDYPAHVINWDWLDDTNPTPAEVLEKADAPVAGGISREAAAQDDTSRAISEASEAIGRVPAERLILGGACTISTDSRDESLLAVRLAAETVGSGE